MAPKQTLSQTNFAGIFSPNDAGEGFKGLVLFLNKSYLGSAITSTPILDLDRIEAFWRTVVAQTEGENPGIQFTISGQQYTLIAEVINTALGITLEAGQQFAELANDDTLKKLFLKIGYTGPILEEGTTKWYPSGEMDRKHSLVHGYKVNVGALLMAHLRAAIEADVGGSSVSQEGDTAPSAANKEASQTEPPVVPSEPKKKRARRTKTTVSQAAVSQQTMVTERDSNTSLDVPSQQGASIEISLSPKAPCTESAQTHGSQPEEPPLEETHSELGHTPTICYTFTFFLPYTFFCFSPQPREGDSPNPSGFDHPSPIMDEPPSSGPQEPISQSEMDTTPPNTEPGQSGSLSENETANTLYELQGASYLQEDAVTASVAVKDTGNVVVLDTAAVMGGEKDTVTTEPTVTPPPKVAVMPEPAVQTPTDSNIYAKDTVQSSQPDFDAVLIEDAFDDDLPLSKLFKVHSKSSHSMHVSTAHTHASRLSEGVQKKREIKEKRGLESQSVRGDEITQKHPESVRTPIASKPLSFPSPPRRLRYGGPSATFGNRIAALEGQCATLNSKMDSLSQLVVDGFAATQLSTQFLTDLVDANSTTGEKVAKSESMSIQ
ncbi:hypothetical protein POM88_022499 [Heracleum sosnowskyi]|uniref:Uncharacterized protein n=1 Tax=Heracleum sosnowskyi TaxID=360622 RepID=A0AAD8IGW1_9APIA|nr:hypothetical protein POM88_022499 [Heracleum sosnowskyi]